MSYIVLWFWSVVFKLVYAMCLWPSFWGSNWKRTSFLFFFRVHKIFFTCWLYLDSDANFTASYPDQLGICLNSVFIKSLVSVSSRSSFQAYSLKTENIYPEIGIALFLSYFANLYSEMYISIHLFPMFTEIKLNLNGWKTKYLLIQSLI